MEPTVQRNHQELEYDKELGEPFEDEGELPDGYYEPVIEQNDKGNFDTCSPIAAAAPFVGPPSRMLLKRSMSPDGRINSISVEIELGIGGVSIQEIKTKGLEALKLETEIAQGYLASLPSPASLTAQTKARAKAQNGSAEESELAVPARLIDIGKTNNYCYFINVKVGDITAKLFGTARQLAAHLAMAGHVLTPEAISDGLKLNLPCRAITKPTSDGCYINVVRISPTA